MLQTYHNKSNPKWATDEVIEALAQTFLFKWELEYGTKEMSKLKGGEPSKNKHILQMNYSFLNLNINRII